MRSTPLFLSNFLSYLMLGGRGWKGWRWGRVAGRRTQYDIKTCCFTHTQRKAKSDRGLSGGHGQARIHEDTKGIIVTSPIWVTVENLFSTMPYVMQNRALSCGENCVRTITAEILTRQCMLLSGSRPHFSIWKSIFRAFLADAIYAGPCSYVQITPFFSSTSISQESLCF